MLRSYCSSPDFPSRDEAERKRKLAAEQDRVRCRKDAAVPYMSICVICGTFSLAGMIVLSYS